MKATALNAANYLLCITGDVFDDMTNMKLNKLLYFAQGHFLQKYGVPLFQDEIEAWDHGPVIPAVYDTYKRCGSKPIKEYGENIPTDMSPEAEEVLYGVARKYGKYTASALRNMTHVVGSPWDQVYQVNTAHVKIPRSVIQDYFANSYEELRPAVKQFQESDFVGYRDSDGILVLPKEWDDEAV